jgi:glycyl-tRNA synthetase beta chain
VEELVTVKRDRGEFLAAIKKIKGQKTEKLLKEILPGIIGELRFRKSMKWGDGDYVFARPIRWILAVYGGKPVGFVTGDVKSASKSFGHRFMSPKAFNVSSWESYAKGLKKGYVMLDQAERKKYIEKEITALAAKIGGKAHIDEELLDTVTYLVEYPVVLKGGFEESFLDLPKEVLISVMKNHQKYFHVESGDGGLLPHFIFVAGTKAKNAGVVIKGNERVIRARFTDARFFYNEDRSRPLAEKAERLKGMVFLSDLGTYYDKTERIKLVAGHLGKELGFENKLPDIIRAAGLSKTDLATQMVFEFPELQGIMGRYYALLSGEKKEVAAAIEEQYKPTSREGDLPASVIGSVISIADKTDTISSCFISGLVPTGTSDPYALRRQAIAIINIAIEKNYHLSIAALFRAALGAIISQTDGKFSERQDNIFAEIAAFIKERFRNIMISDGFPQDVVEAAVSVEFDDVVDVKRRIEALAEFRKAPDFESLGVAFKRVVNIVKGQPRGEVRESVFVEPAEKDLYLSFAETREKAGVKMSEKNYRESLSIMRKLKEPVDKFFDSVMVMDENEELRNNRLSMLWEIRELFFRIADFSKLST